MTDDALARYRAIIVDHDPSLGDARFTLLERGWDSLAVDVDDRLVFKFPRDEEVAAQLAREVRLLDLVRPRVTMRVPALRLIDGKTPFSRHEKIPGAHLELYDYLRLDEHRRDALAEALAIFFAQLHAIPAAVARAHGAEDPDIWPDPDAILAGCRRYLAPEMLAVAGRVLAEWQAAPADPHGRAFGFFDGHGWNIAFDHAAGRLVGVYDFGDAGIDDLHQEFIYPGFTAPDLAARTIVAYERVSGRPIDRRRVALLSGVLRLVELAEDGDHPTNAALIRSQALAWLALLG